MSKDNARHNRFGTFARLLLLMGFVGATAGLTACKGCGKTEKPEEDTQAAEDTAEPDVEEDTLDMEKAEEEAEKAAVSIAISMADRSRYISGNVEAENTPSEPAPNTRPPADPTGKIDTAKLREVFRKVSGQARDCYERQLKRNPNLAGRVILNITIGTDGSVAAVSAQGDTLNDQAVNDCLERQAKRWTFPKPEGGAARVRKPFSFSPKQ